MICPPRSWFENNLINDRCCCWCRMVVFFFIWSEILPDFLNRYLYHGNLTIYFPLHFSFLISFHFSLFLWVFFLQTTAFASIFSSFISFFILFYVWSWKQKFSFCSVFSFTLNGFYASQIVWDFSQHITHTQIRASNTILSRFEHCKWVYLKTIIFGLGLKRIKRTSTHITSYQRTYKHV